MFPQKRQRTSAPFGHAGTLPQTDVLTGVSVQKVTPAPHAGRLCVVIAVHDFRHHQKVAAIVQRHSGRLLAEVAATITRRRAPELTFEIVPEGGDDD